MSRKSYSRPEGYQYLDAFTKEVQHIEGEHRVFITVEAHRTDQVGVLCFHLTAHDLAPGPAMLGAVARYKGTYPTAQNALLEGFLFSSAIKLGQMVAEYREAQKATRN